jgi:hypothetical protein
MAEGLDLCATEPLASLKPHHRATKPASPDGAAPIDSQIGPIAKTDLPHLADSNAAGRRASHRGRRKSHPAPRKPRGYVIYRGPSLLNGEPIVCVLILRSENGKTGDMAQAYVLADHGERPTQALRSGRDASVCGKCKHRPAKAGTCYVVVRQGPTRVWDALMRGRYPDVCGALHVAAEAIAGRMVRITAYGDPAAVPLSVWRAVTARASDWTAFTHQ